MDLVFGRNQLDDFLRRQAPPHTIVCSKLDVVAYPCIHSVGRHALAFLGLFCLNFFAVHQLTTDGGT